jgi:hypothetical protein
MFLKEGATDIKGLVAHANMVATHNLKLKDLILFLHLALAPALKS